VRQYGELSSIEEEAVYVTTIHSKDCPMGITENIWHRQYYESEYTAT